MSEPSITAIIPVHNRPTLVIDALGSVAAQTRAPDELIIVDDGSTDGTAARVQEWLDSKALPYPAHLLRQPNTGAAGARNNAAHRATGELIAFLDSDDLWPDDYLRRMAAAFTTAPTLIAATCDLFVTELDRRRESLLDFSWARGRVTPHIVRHGTTGTPNTVLRADAYRKVGGQDTQLKFGEDRHLFLRISLLGDWAYVPGKPVVNRIGHALERGEQNHFGRDHADPCRLNAQVMERFILEEGGASAVPARLYRRALARWWFEAGRQLERLGRSREARACYMRGLHWRPVNPKAWWRALVTSLARRG